MCGITGALLAAQADPNAAPEPEAKKTGFPWAAALAGAGVMMLFTLILISTGILAPV